MNEKDLKYFVQTTINFFKETSGQAAKCGIPHIKNGNAVVLEYSGIIGVSGKRKGSIYYTANKDQLLQLAKLMLHNADISNEDLKDLVGEIANTISGNLRELFGPDFFISVPIIIEGKARDIKLPKDIDSYVIPISWQSFNSYLVVCIE